MSATDMDWATLAQSLAQGAAGELPAPLNVLGAALLAQIFPDSSVDWATISQQFGAIVQQDLDQSFLDQTAGSIQGILSYMGTSYANDKASGTVPKSTLSSNLEDQNQDCYKLIGQLEQSEYEQAGLANFLVAAGVHLTINQEKALVDPNVTDPTSSPAAKTVSQLASDYVTQAYAVKALLRTSRQNCIGSIQSDIHSSVNGRSVKKFGSYSFTDSFTGQTTTEQGDDPDGDGNTLEKAYTKIQAERNAAIVAAGSGFDATVGANIETTAIFWGQLVDNPIPIKS